jgi:hypothetical protein
MLKRLSICAPLVAFGTVPATAENQEVILRKIDVPTADFALVFAVPNPGAAATINRGQQDALIIHSIGGEFAHAVEGEIEAMFKDVGLSRFPIGAFHVELSDGASTAFKVYVVPNSSERRRQ